MAARGIVQLLFALTGNLVPGSLKEEHATSFGTDTDLLKPPFAELLSFAADSREKFTESLGFRNRQI